MSRRSRPTWVYLALTAVLGVLVLMLWLGEDSGQVQPKMLPAHNHDVVFEEAAVPDVAPPPVVADKQPASPVVALPQHGIALILDDVGFDLPALRRALALKVPMAIAILPNAPHAAEAARLAHDAGYTVMLHMPMEPGNPHYSRRMDSSFIRVGMTREQVRRKMAEALIRVPFVEGLNNHMGSRLTELEEPMRWVMQVCSEQKLFFIDSRTNKDSVAARMAREQGLSWGERRIFLDDSVQPELLKDSWMKARSRLGKDGSVIVIAHPHKETLEFLEQNISAADRAAMVSITGLLTMPVPGDAGAGGG